MSSPLFASHGQSGGFGSAIGVRGAYGIGLSYVQNISEPLYFEAIGMIESGTLFGSLLFEIKNDIGPEGLRWFYGVGGTAGIGEDFALGPTGVLGIEFNFSDVPLNFTLDWQPTIFLVKSPDLDGFYGRSLGVGIRWVLN